MSPADPPIIQGDPFGDLKKPASQGLPNAVQVNQFHTNDDVDSQQGAHHHTLGIKHDQASPGDHKHDGVNSRKLLDGESVTGSTASVALKNLLTLLVETMGLDDNTSF